MTKRLKPWLIPVCAFFVAVLLAKFAEPTLGFSARAMSAATGQKYYCVHCNLKKNRMDSQESDQDLTGQTQPGFTKWKCYKQGPVNFTSGANEYSHADFGSPGLSGLMVDRLYLQDPTWSDNSMGPCWRFGWLYRLVRSGASVSVIVGNEPVMSFVDNGNGTYTNDFNYLGSLAADTVNHLLVLTDMRGKVWKFFDFSSTWAAARQGRQKEFDDRGGNITTTIFGTSGVTLDKLLELQQTDTNPNLFHRLDFAYNLSGASAGLLSTVTYSQTNTGVTTTVRVANFTYYTSSGPNGPAGTLQRVKITDGSSNILETSYYRYNSVTASGFVPLRYAVNPRSYDRMSAALGGDAAIDSATDTTVATYADYFFQYDAQNRVTQENVQHDSCSCGSPGSGGVSTLSFQSATHGLPDGPNIWRNKCTVVLPDGNIETVYTNSAGQNMLEVFKDSSTGLQWLTYRTFNTDYSMAAVAFPSAVTGFSESTGGLVSGAQTPASTGLWHLLNYYTATNLSTGAVAKYCSTVQLRQGSAGAPVLLETNTYTSRTGTTATIFPLLTRTSYRNTDGTGAQSSTHSYTWQGNTTQILQETITLPVVPTTQNGSGSAPSITVQLDAFGRTTWMKDADGFISQVSYDTLTGAPTQSIVDVNTSVVSGAPAGWTTPAGGGLNLTTTAVVDPLGRSTRVTDPLGQVTYTVYKDPQHEIRAYPGWNASTNLPTGPTQLQREDHAGSYNEVLAMSAAPHVTSGAPDGTEAVSGLQVLTRTYLDAGNRITNTDSYFNFTGLTYSTAPNIGTLGTNFYRAVFGYDQKGRKSRVQDWNGTISRTVFDVLDRPSSTWIGTNDTPASGVWSPTNNTAPSNMVQATGLQYDSGGVGDGVFTKSSLFTSSTVSLDTVYQYDFRDRQVQKRGPDNVAVQRTYDNLGEVTGLSVYADANRNFVIDAGELRGKVQTSFDERGMVYQTVRLSVDPSTGAVGDSITKNQWFNARGMLIKSRDANGQFAKSQYDGAGRAIANFASFDDAETSYADASTVANDIVVEETVTAYDAASNVIQTTSYLRTTSTAKTGDLSATWSANDSRRSFTAYWYDAANRLITFGDYGTNNGTALTRPATAPAPNTAGVLVTKYGFDAGGREFQRTDNLNRVSQRTFDGLGRITQLIENYVTGSPTETSLDTDRKTTFSFDSVGRLSQQVSYNPKGTGNGVQLQTTTFVYGTSAVTDLQGHPPVFRNDLLAAEIFPDSDDTYNPATGQFSNGTDGVYDRREYIYDYAGRKTSTKDQRGAVRTLSYDSAGRVASDNLGVVPSTVDSTIRQLSYLYDDLSRPKSFQSLDGGLHIFNEVKTTYDGWGNPIKREDSHVGAVVSGTTPSAQAAYTDGGSGGVGKYIRPVSMTYPNGRVVFINYPAAGSTSVGDHLSRVDNLANDSAGTTQFAQYTFMGVGRVLDISHPLVTNGLIYRQGPDTNPGAWDQFDRQIYTKWRNSAVTSTHDMYNYSYDAGNQRLTRQNAASTLPATRNDENYTYDGLARLKKMNRGQLTGSPLTISDASANYAQQWPALESLGNWRQFQVAPSGANNYTFQQTRSHNSANEMDVDNNDANLPGASISNSWIAPSYDKAGNSTTVPQPSTVPQSGGETVGYFVTYDGWNRLVKIQSGTRAAPGAEIAEYQYDAQGRRTVKLAPNGPNWNRTDYYYDLDWKCLEERTLVSVVGKTTVATTPSFQWVWDLRYTDAVLLRDVVPIDTTKRLFYCQDANMNTTALVNSSGSVVERYVYDPYGKPTVLSGTWTSQSSTLYGNEMLFGGYRLDPESGLYHVRARAYHPTLGRWMQRDPLGYPAGANLYEYGGSSPVVRIDPSGLDHCDLTLSSVTVTGSYAVKGATDFGGDNPRNSHKWTDGIVTMTFQLAKNDDEPSKCPGDTASSKCCVVTGWLGHLDPVQDQMWWIMDADRGSNFDLVGSPPGGASGGNAGYTWKALTLNAGTGSRMGFGGLVKIDANSGNVVMGGTMHQVSVLTIFQWDTLHNSGTLPPYGYDLSNKMKPNPTPDGTYALDVPWSAKLGDECREVTNPRTGKKVIPIIDSRAGTLKMQMIYYHPNMPELSFK
jgi:RHS repeat-associated protein